MQEQQVCPPKSWLRRNYRAILVILGVIALVVVIFLYQDSLKGLGNYGYLGAFLISVVASLTIVLPVPGIVIVVSLATIFNPWLVALAGGAGSILGELTGYILGLSGSTMLKNNRWYARAESWMKRWGFWSIFIFAVSFLPFDFAGIAAGTLRYPLWKFLLAGFAGKVIKYMAIVAAAVYGFQNLLRYLGI